MSRDDLKLTADKLRWECDPAQFTFTTTAEIIAPATRPAIPTPNVHG